MKKIPLYCKDCNVEIFADVNMVMLKDELWLSIAKKEDALCDCCIERKLCRLIQKEDFKSQGIPCNEFWLLRKSKMSKLKHLI